MSNDIFSKHNGVIPYISALENFSKTLKQYELPNIPTWGYMNQFADYLNSFNIPSIYIMENALKPLIEKINKQIESINLSIKTNPIKIQWLYYVNNIISQTILSLAGYRNSYEIDAYLRLNLYGVIARDTGYIVRTKEIDVDEAFEKAVPVKINKLSLSITDKLSKIKFIDSALIKQTSNDYVNVGNIVGLIANTKENFLAIINSCYMLFYEGFGGSKHRSEKYIPFDKYPALYDIKQLRLYTDHDVEHGDESKIQKNKNKIFDVFKKFINKNLPILEKDYKQCQYELYKEINEWLENLLHQINCGTQQIIKEKHKVN